jgi:hypothetical protein
MGRKNAVLIGGPGTGKTTELLNVMESAKAALGGSPFAIGFTSLTRAARAEAVARASAAWSIPPEVLSKQGWFRTCHSVAHRQLKVEKGQLIDDSKASQSWVADALGVDIRVILDDDSGCSVYAGDSSASAALNCWEISRSRVEPLIETIKKMSAVGRQPPTFAECKQFITRYEDAKRLEGRYDFADLLSRFAGIHFDLDGFYEVEPEGELPPGVRAWIFDEAQDASALVDRVCRRLASGPEVLWTYIAGDPFQCQPAGTPVLTADGYKPIEAIVPGEDTVFAFCKKTLSFVDGVEFQKAFRDVDSGELFEIAFSDGTKSVCTGNHKWLTDDGSAVRRFTQTHDLVAGLHAVPKRLSHGGHWWVDVSMARRLPPGETVRVYSLEVERHHTYVTTNGIVTGNSIFGFGGSDCRHFLSWSADKRRVMKKSWRCPAAVMSLGEKCLRRMHEGYWDREIAPADHEGEVVRGGHPSAIIPKLDPNNETLILARCNYTLDDWASEMKQKGIPFLRLKAKENTNAIRGIRALWDLEHGEPVSGEDFAHAVAGLPARGKEGPLLTRGTKAAWTLEATQRRWNVIFPSDLEDIGVTPAMIGRLASGHWAELIVGGERWRRSALRWGADLATRPHIRIGTIHSAKGMEADSVILSTTTSRKIYESQAADREAHDEERRVEYVGVTRARKKLVISDEPCDYKMSLRP